MPGVLCDITHGSKFGRGHLWSPSTWAIYFLNVPCFRVLVGSHESAVGGQVLLHRPALKHAIVVGYGSSRPSALRTHVAITRITSTTLGSHVVVILQVASIILYNVSTERQDGYTGRAIV